MSLMFFDPTSALSFFTGLPLLDLALPFPMLPCIDTLDKLRAQGVNADKSVQGVLPPRDEQEQV